MSADLTRPVDIERFVRWLEKSGYAICEINPTNTSMQAWTPVKVTPRQWARVYLGLRFKRRRRSKRD